MRATRAGLRTVSGGGGGDSWLKTTSDPLRVRKRYLVKIRRPLLASASLACPAPFRSRVAWRPSPPHPSPTIVQCAQDNVAQGAAYADKLLAALGKLIGLINLFMGMVGGPEIPDLSDLAGRPLDDMVEPLDAIVDALKNAHDAVPVP